MNAPLHPAIARALAAPKTHTVATRFASGHVRFFDTRCSASAANYATGEGRKVGRDLISRDTGATVRVVDVRVYVIADLVALADDAVDSGRIGEGRMTESDAVASYYVNASAAAPCPDFRAHLESILKGSN